MKGIPKAETIWMVLVDRDGSKFYITSKSNDRELYYIYQEQGDEVARLGKNRDPRELERKFIVY